MIDLRDVRAALRKALEGEGYNYSDGGDFVPQGATVDPFAVTYHANIAGGQAGLASAATLLRVVLDRGDETSAMGRIDDVMTDLPPVIERAPGPWHSVFIRQSSVSSPVTVGDATYATVDFIIEFYV